MKVIITDLDHDSFAIEDAILREAGLPYELHQCRTEDAVIEECQGAEIFLNQYAPITERVMEALPRLGLVVRYGVGYNNIDVKAATRHGVQVCNIPDYGTNEVADHAFALMLALTRKIVLMNDRTKHTAWDYTQAIPIRRHGDMVVGVVGLGRIGRAFARRVKALDCSVIGYDPYYFPEECADFIRRVELDELIRTADVISIHCPPDSAMGMFNAETFRAMKRSAVLINVARGGIVDEAALDEALEKGEIAGAGLDCMAAEPMAPGSRLFRHENLICTPHMAWYSEEAARELNRKVAEQAVLFAAGKPVRYPVNQV